MLLDKLYINKTFEFSTFFQLNIQLERLKTSGRESRKRQKMLQLQIRSLVEERADFLAQLQDQHREIVSLKNRLGMAEKENEDLSWDLSKCHDADSNEARFSTTELKEILVERDHLKAQICDLEAELKHFRPSEEDSSPEEERYDRKGFAHLIKYKLYVQIDF